MAPEQRRGYSQLGLTIIGAVATWGGSQEGSVFIV